MEKYTNEIVNGIKTENKRFKYASLFSGIGGFEDTRGTLIYDVVRIAAEKQPNVILLENVKGLIGHDKGATLDTIVKIINEIGYRVDFQVLNSKFFGVPQNRERIFIVCIREDLIENEDWVIEGNNVVAKGKKRISQYDGVKTFNFDYPTNDTIQHKLSDFLLTNVDEKYYLDEEKAEKLVKQMEERDNKAIKESSVGGYREPIVTIPTEHSKQDYRAVLTPDRTNKSQNGRQIKESDEPMFTLTAQDQHGVAESDKVLFIKEATKQGYAIAEIGDAVNTQFPNSETRRGRVGKEIANTLEASGCNQGVVTTDIRIRKLTPKECWRLQGFTDEQHDLVEKTGISNSQRYKQAGNAVTVNVIYAIGERLIPYL